MTPVLKNFFEKAWDDYKKRAPEVQKIESFFHARSETIVNDHIALRTLNFPGATKEDVASFFETEGYEIKESYSFVEKKLKAIHLEASEDLPKIFISELLVEEMLPEVQKILSPLRHCCKNFHGLESFLEPRPWLPRFDFYEKCVDSSEYASWFYAHGWVVNHFTVSVNQLKTFSHLKDLNDALEAQGFVLNESGGKIKGTSADLLEQSSTMAPMGMVEFEETKSLVPTSYYEFAFRHKKSNGELFQGFVPSSADRIFESTDRKTK